ncbi:MAG: carboxylase [Deltaproteobacteria bacterium]|nr:carboxylase [Deltaproteobacteria bacterium]
MSEVKFVDTTLRDGQASLWAENMRTGMMLAVAERIDNAGFQAIEIIASSHIKKCVRELREDPFERMRQVAKKITKTPLRAIGAERISAFELSPDAIVDLWFERMVANGMKQLRISDPANDPAGWKKSVARAKRVGLTTIVNQIYSVSPKHTDEYYARKAREAAALKPDIICLKDPGGLLVPERTNALVEVIKKNAPGIPIELHVHCTTGLGPLCALEAIKLDVELIDTSIPPLANASSNPSVFNVAQNAHSIGYSPLVDLETLAPVEKNLTFIAKRENLPIGEPVEYDYSQYVHQVPGGMISNLRFQLKNIGMLDRLDKVLEEAVRVRADLGYPIMVTPFSQFVGSQAAINVIKGERYAQVTDQVIQYAMGLWGEEAASEVAPNVKDKILNRPRAKEFAGWQPPQPSLEEMRSKLGGPSLGDDELLMRYVAGNEDVDAMRAAGAPKQYSDTSNPLLTLVQELSQRKDCSQIYVQKDGLSLTLEKRAGLNRQ